MTVTNRILFILIFFPLNLFAEQPIDLNYGWNISYNNIKLEKQPIDLNWKKLSTKSTLLSVEYTKEFTLPHIKQNKDLVLITPNNWVKYNIFFNDIDLSQLTGENGVGTYIYRKRIIKLNKEFLKDNNIIKIKSTGNKFLGGFKTKDFFIVDGNQNIFKEKIHQFIYNDIHFGFLILSLIMGSIFLFVSFKTSIDRMKNIAICIASLSLIPYHLLTTNIYGNIFSDSTSPFRFQLVFQTLTWMAWSYYLTLTLGKKSWFNFMNSIRFIRIVFAYFTICLVLSFVAPFHIFQIYLMPAFIMPSIIILPWWLKLKDENPIIIFFSGIAIILAYATFASDIFSLNYYFSGYSIAIFTSIALYSFLKSYMKASKKLQSTSSFVEYLLPNPIMEQIESLINNGANVETIRNNIRCDKSVSTIFIDICSFGVMTAQISSTIVYKTRSVVFRELSELLKKHDIHFIKPMGDSAHFCGGISNNNNQTETATNCIRGVIDILDNIDQINILLKSLDLPSVKFKISATIGHAELGLEGTLNDLRFDVQGHWINMAKRLEDSMDKNFYSKYGYNCALLSEQLFKFSRDIKLQERFPTSYYIEDKHNIPIKAFIGKQYANQVNKEDALEAIYGQFAHDTKKKVS